jgi:hypothetical protein
VCAAEALPLRAAQAALAHRRPPLARTRGGKPPLHIDSLPPPPPYRLTSHLDLLHQLSNIDFPTKAGNNSIDCWWFVVCQSLQAGDLGEAKGGEEGAEGLEEDDDEDEGGEEEGAAAGGLANAAQFDWRESSKLRFLVGRPVGLGVRVVVTVA